VAVPSIFFFYQNPANGKNKTSAYQQNTSKTDSENIIDRLVKNTLSIKKRHTPHTHKIK